MIENEKGKSRMTVDSALRKTKSWRLLCLSSGEIDIEAQSSKGIGIFEDLRGWNNGNEFSIALAEKTSRYYGTAAKFFVDEVRKIDEATIRNIFDEALARIKSALQLENVKDGATSRVLNSFALINTAGILASGDYIGVFKSQ